MFIERPERRNALTPNMYFGIRRAVDHVNQSPSLRALVLTGTGDVFAPGGELGGQYDDGEVNYGALLGTGVLPFEAIRESRKPVIASVNGLCMGGGLLITMLVRHRGRERPRLVRRARARAGRRRRVPRRDPPRARRHRGPRDMLFTSRRLNAQEALQFGLVARVVPHEQLEAETNDVVRDVLRAAPKARVALKRLINARYGAVDRITFDESLAADEVVEGFQSFMEKRPPSWVPRTDRRAGPRRRRCLSRRA